MNRPALWRDPGVDREMARLEQSIEALKERVARARYAAALQGEPSEAEVRAMLAERRTREAIIGEDLFADPAWDMLLGLYGAYLGQRILSTSQLVSASAVPATTALRWIDKLDSVGLVERTPDPHDRRRVSVELSQAGVAKMRSYFAAIRSGVSPN